MGSVVICYHAPASLDSFSRPRQSTMSLLLRSSSVLAVFLLLVAPAAADVGKRLPDSLERIRDAKAAGERYMGMTWHAAEELQRRTTARVSGQRAVGASNPSTAIPVDANPFLDQGTTVGMGNDSVGGGCLTGGDDVSEDVWYELTFTTAVELTVWTTCASTGPASFDTRLSLFDQDLLLLSCNDDAPDCGQPHYQSKIEDTVVPAGTYYVVVDGYNGDAGDYEFNATWNEAVGFCEGSDADSATPIQTLPFVETASTVGACDDILVDCELQVGSSGPDRWYRLDVDRPVLLDVRTTCEESDLDTRLAVLTSDFTTLYCNDDDPLCTSHQSEIADAYVDAGIYYLVVDGPEGVDGSFTVEVDTTHAPVGSVENRLPDVVVVENDLYDHVLTTDVAPGRVHLRLSNGTANLGAGKVYLYGVLPEPGSTSHEVRQRVWRTDGTWFDRAAGTFVYHPGHNHIHVEAWNQYNLREILPGDGVGPIVASGTKTSFCILDLRVQDGTLPGHPPGGEFLSCDSTIQGLSVGWADIYSKSLPDQWIDVTDVPEGTYWLESVVDPANHILESDDTNNVARIQVTIGFPDPINPDAFEPNGSVETVDTRPTGGSNSPNLGPCAPQRTLTGLTIHDSADRDWYRFYLPAAGTGADSVHVDYDPLAGEVGLRVTDGSNGDPWSLRMSPGQKSVSLEGLAAGWYYVEVFGIDGATCPSYSLTIDPSQNASPTVEVTAPPPGGVELVQAIDAYPVTWTSSDPEANETWAKVWVNTAPVLDGNEFFFETSLNTPADLGAFVVSTTYIPVGSYYVYVEVTDGGTVVGDWSEGTLDLVAQATSAPAANAASRLLAASPNPFNPRTTLRLELARHVDDLEWNVYDVRGALVRRLPGGHLHPGRHERVWDGRDDQGRRVASGVYFGVVRASGLDLSQRLVLIK